ncbi:MAG: sigma-70 family RNA polymerase sigma factor [Myxococcaceae bacterium]
MRAEDERLLQLVALRDDAALEQLYDRYAPLLMGVALRITRQTVLAEEVVQEVFMQAWQRAREYEAKKATAVAWLVMLARSRALDRARAEGALARRGAALTSDLLVQDTKLASADELLIKKVEHDRLRNALKRLPEEQCHALSLAFYEGLSQSEIAEHLGAPLGTVKTRIRRGMEQLSTILHREEPPDST